MGLDFAIKRGEGDYVDLPKYIRFSYSGFNQFRRAVGFAALDIDIEGMRGLGGDGDWSEYYHDPIFFLLDHSDCDGKLVPWQCRLVADRLDEIWASLSMRPILDADGDEEQRADGSLDEQDAELQDSARRLALAFHAAAECNADLIFC
jgi:hypothetical protein